MIAQIAVCIIDVCPFGQRASPVSQASGTTHARAQGCVFQHFSALFCSALQRHPSAENFLAKFVFFGVLGTSITK